ncbi:hypothetical protein Leryth_003306 [Lithospermum erythrorhizon]|nr:hypothetical protein Leryth_003306 [Lithospermum erythrorhizon]
MESAAGVMISSGVEVQRTSSSNLRDLLRIDVERANSAILLDFLRIKQEGCCRNDVAGGGGGGGGGTRNRQTLGDVLTLTKNSVSNQRSLLDAIRDDPSSFSGCGDDGGGGSGGGSGGGGDSGGGSGGGDGGGGDSGVNGGGGVVGVDGVVRGGGSTREIKRNWRQLRKKMKLGRGLMAIRAPDVAVNRNSLSELLQRNASVVLDRGSLNLYNAVGNAEGEAAGEGPGESSGGVGEPARMSLMALLGGADSAYIINEMEEDDEVEEEGEEEVGKLLEYNACCVCMVRHKGAAFIPCGHTFCRGFILTRSYHRTKKFNRLLFDEAYVASSFIPAFCEREDVATVRFSSLCSSSIFIPTTEFCSDD